jgi:hypothetical protein
MTWIFNPRGEPSKGERRYCQLKVNTAEAAIAGIGVTNVHSYRVAQAVVSVSAGLSAGP